MANYEETRMKLTNRQLNKLKCGAGKDQNNIKNKSLRCKL